MIALTPAWKPAAVAGGFFAMALDVLVLIPRKPFAWREFVAQAWFVARVSLMPTVMLAVPYSVLVVFTFNILLLEFGAADFSGTAAASPASSSRNSCALLAFPSVLLRLP